MDIRILTLSWLREFSLLSAGSAGDCCLLCKLAHAYVGVCRLAGFYDENDVFSLGGVGAGSALS